MRTIIHNLRNFITVYWCIVFLWLLCIIIFQYRYRYRLLFLLVPRLSSSIVSIDRRFVRRSKTDGKAQQSASECVHAEMHASADNSWLQAYVGDLIVHTDPWARSTSQMVIRGFGLVKHITSQLLRSTV